jgi:hypothetical protein
MVDDYTAERERERERERQSQTTGKCFFFHYKNFQKQHREKKKYCMRKKN